MVKSMLAFVATLLAFEAFFSVARLSSGSGFVTGVNGNRFDLASQWNCAHVIQNPIEVRRELVSRNLDGDHKIIKFIENCIKSVDGWRFKKSDPNKNSLRSGNSLAAVRSAVSAAAESLPDRVLPYPVHFVLLSQLDKQVDSSSRQSQEVSSQEQVPKRASVLRSLPSASMEQQSQQQQPEPQFFGYAA